MQHPIDMHFELRSAWCSTLALAGLLACVPTINLCAQTATPVQHLEQQQLVGGWFEIAHLPDKREKACVGSGLEMITLADKDNHFLLVDSCRNKKGYTESRNLSARRDKGSTDGRLKISTLLWLTRPYWVLAMGPDQQWLLTGTPNHKELWIYAKTRDVSPEVMATIKAQAAAQGFATDKLQTTQQPKHPENKSNQSPTPPAV